MRLARSINYSIDSTHKAVWLYKYGEKGVYRQCPVPRPALGELLVKIDASVVHSCDIGRMAGTYRPVILPTVLGLEGTGRVVEANGQHLQHWVGQRIFHYYKPGGSWADYAAVDADICYPIHEDLPMETAIAGGVGNPITVVGMTEIYSALAHKRGIISSGASSMTGRLLSKHCKKLGIPCLNLVRREEQERIMRDEGAEHVIVTKGNWQDKYRQAIKSHGFNVYYDGLGGGPITEAVVMGLQPNSTVFVYGELAHHPFSLKRPFVLSPNIWVSAYLMSDWWDIADPKRKEEIRSQYCGLLRNYMHTKVCHVRKFRQLEEALELSVKCASEGRVMLLPG